MEEKKTLKEVIEEAGRADNFTCALCDAFDGNPCSTSGTPKDDCYMNVACLLIDAIDREFIERPRFEDGEPVQFGDKFVSPFDSDNHLTVAEIAVNSEGRYLLRIGNNCGWYAYLPGERVKRPKPEERPDSLERILDDLTMSPWDYCNHHGGTAPGQDESDCIAYMMRDLLARQRKVLERDRNE